MKSKESSLGKLDEMNKENCLLKNSLRDAELEISKLKEEGGSSLKKYIDQSNRINDLERENRGFRTEVDYLR